MANDLVLITDEQAKALQEGFKLAGQTLDVARDLGRYLGGVLGSVPEDLVGLLGGDWLRVRRAENVVRMMRQARELLEARGVEPEPAPLSVALPLLQGAADEDREELVDLWARLLAAALDPARRNKVRRKFVEIVQKMEPLDALVLEQLGLPRTVPGQESSARDRIAGKLSYPPNDVEVSLMHLDELGCVFMGSPGVYGSSGIHINALGRELLAILSD